MRKLFASIAVLGGLIAFGSQDASAQTRYGTTVSVKNGNTTTYTCPSTSTSTCQVWGNNADGSRFVVVFVREADGSTRTINVGVMKAAAPVNDGRSRMYIIDPEMNGTYWEATHINN